MPVSRTIFGGNVLDTNFLIGLLKSSPEVVERLSSMRIRICECAYSCITRMKLLGFQGLSDSEEILIRETLDTMVRIDLSILIEDRVIRLRRSRKVKMPDAIIAATALIHELELITLDQHLKIIMNGESDSKRTQ